MEKQIITIIPQQWLVPLIILLAILFVFYLMYVSLVKKKNNVKEAFASIDTHLKQRYDLIPNILTIANKFMEHERELLTNITFPVYMYDRTSGSIKKIEITKEIEEQINDSLDIHNVFYWPDDYDEPLIENISDINKKTL
jgi:hypothetical protein